jgi:subtilisin family serine protease
MCDSIRSANPGVDITCEANSIVESTVTPNDPQYGSLYGMTKISAPLAWDISTGSTSSVVAIIDTGIDYTHPDLVDNIATNPREVPNNGVDDDGNGYIDDYYGYDFINNDSNPIDDHYHGTKGSPG